VESDFDPSQEHTVIKPYRPALATKGHFPLPKTPCSEKNFARQNKSPTSPHRARPRCHRKQATTAPFASSFGPISTPKTSFYDLIAFFRGFSAA
jgi:hypothetical protein